MLNICGIYDKKNVNGFFIGSPCAVYSVLGADVAEMVFITPYNICLVGLSTELHSCVLLLAVSVDHIDCSRSVNIGKSSASCVVQFIVHLFSDSMFNIL